MARGGRSPLCGLEIGIPKAPPPAQADTPDLPPTIGLTLSGPRVRQNYQGQGWGNQTELDHSPTLALPAHDPAEGSTLLPTSREGAR